MRRCALTSLVLVGLLVVPAGVAEASFADRQSSRAVVSDLIPMTTPVPSRPAR